MTQLRTISVTSSSEGWTLSAGDHDGRVRGTELELGGTTVHVARTGSRWELRSGTGTPVLRFDPAGRKATTLTTASGRYRLARLRSRPLQHRWQLTHDLRSEPVLRISHTPVGHRLVVEDATLVPAVELPVLALGALASVLGLTATELVA